LGGSAKGAGYACGPKPKSLTCLYKHAARQKLLSEAAIFLRRVGVRGLVLHRESPSGNIPSRVYSQPKEVRSCLWLRGPGHVRGLCRARSGSDRPTSGGLQGLGRRRIPSSRKLALSGLPDASTSHACLRPTSRWGDSSDTTARGVVSSAPPRHDRWNRKTRLHTGVSASSNWYPPFRQATMTDRLQSHCHHVSS